MHFVASAGTRLEGDAQGSVPANYYQTRKDALACLVAIANEAVGRRRLNSDVRAKISKFCEALLAGAVDLRVAVELFGGIAPAVGYATPGFEEANGTWGKMASRADIKQALALVLTHHGHAPLRGPLPKVTRNVSAGPGIRDVRYCAGMHPQVG